MTELGEQEMYEAQFLQMPLEETEEHLDNRPLQILNLTKKMSNQNNMSSEIETSMLDADNLSES